MRLYQLKLKNFRWFKDEATINFSDLTTFIWKNDAWKSTILEALEIFFNNEIVTCEREDLSISWTIGDIEISCIFEEFPTTISIDGWFPTSLTNEFLLNTDGRLEIKKVFSATAAKPKEKIFIRCNHPTNPDCANLLELKRQELKVKATALWVGASTYNATINSSIREAIRLHCGDLMLNEVDLLVDKEDSRHC